ncbi:MAG TPA: methyl-accepting chemotaxis protein [Rhodospirillales bacterium]|nr:methyl-accepting chemotaxis protein [Rhodospirillales bacterium]
MHPAMVTGGAAATKPERKAAARLPGGAIATAVAGAAAAFATLAIVEDAATAATGAAVVACTLLVSEGLLRRLRHEPPAPAPAEPAPEPLAEAPAGGPDAPAPVSLPEPAAAGPVAAKLAALCDYVEKLPDLFAIMKEHTRNVITDTERASYSFIDNLGEIDRKIKALKEFLLSSQQDISAIDLKSSESDARNDKLLDQIRRSFAQNSELIASIIDERSGFSGVVETMRRLHQELAVIGEIARRIKLLALNASIEAARAAQYGAGFAVIAKEIRELSEQTNTATRTLSPLIAAACSSVEAFAADHGVERRLRAQLDLLETMQVHLAGLSKTYGEMLAHERALTAHTGEHGVEIESAICRTLADLQFQDIVRQQLEGVIGAYDSLHVEIGGAVGAIRGGEGEGRPDPAAVEALIAEMHDRYVMARQRTSHATANANASGEGDGPPVVPGGGSGALAIELF